LLLTGAGMLRGGAGTETDVGLLGRQARLREVEERVQELERQVERATADVACTESELRACRSERRDVEQALRDNDAELVQLSLTQASLGTAFEECNDRCGQAQRSLGEVEAEQERLDRMLPELTEDAERLASEGDAQGKAVADLEAQFEAIEREREQQR